MVIEVTLDGEHNGLAIERFTKRGPLAFLPMGTKEGVVIWTFDGASFQETTSWSDAVLLENLQRAMGYRLSRFKSIGKRFQYPLTMSWVEAPGKGSVLLIGDAAHGLHPIAGQGFNLGLVDVAVLRELFVDVSLRKKAPSELVGRYMQLRKKDIDYMIKLTDRLVGLFCLDLLPVNLGRGVGMSLCEHVPFLKKQLANRLMGFGQAMPKKVVGEVL